MQLFKTNLLGRSRGREEGVRCRVGWTVGRRESKDMELSSGAGKITLQGSGGEDGMRERSGGGRRDEERLKPK